MEHFLEYHSVSLEPAARDEKENVKVSSDNETVIKKENDFEEVLEVSVKPEVVTKDDFQEDDDFGNESYHSDFNNDPFEEENVDFDDNDSDFLANNIQDDPDEDFFGETDFGGQSSVNFQIDFPDDQKKPLSAGGIGTKTTLSPPSSGLMTGSSSKTGLSTFK